MKKLFKRFAKNEAGATAIEYGLIAALISITIIGGARLIGNEIGETFTAISTAVNSTQTP